MSVVWWGIVLRTVPAPGVISVEGGVTVRTRVVVLLLVALVGAPPLMQEWGGVREGKKGVVVLVLWVVV